MKKLELACRHLRTSALAVAAAFLVICSLTSTSVAQDIPAPVSPSMDKMVGAVVVVLPDYEGSDDFKFGAAPLLMYKFTGDRYVQVIGNKAFLNVSNHPNWEAGLKGVYRLGRKKVDDPLVSGLDKVDDSLELGGFIGYRHVIGGDFRHRYVMHLDITQDVSDGHEGYVVEAAGVYWRPVAKAFDMGLRFGLTWASSDYNSSFFDVTAAETVRTGLRTFDAEAGFKDVKVGLMGLFHLSQNWHVGGGLYYGRMLGDAHNSPVVDDQGSANQLFAGLSLLYSW
jgi:outer membrane protein